MAPVILEMDVHCSGCASKIRKTIRNLLGVEKVWVSPDTGLVVVAGTADAAALRSRIERKMRRNVAIVSDGMAETTGTDHTALAHYVGMRHLAPPPLQYAPPPPLPAPHGGWGVAPPHHYGTPQYPYAGNHWATHARH